MGSSLFYALANNCQTLKVQYLGQTWAALILILPRREKCFQKQRSHLRESLMPGPALSALSGSPKNRWKILPPFHFQKTLLPPWRKSGHCRNHNLRNDQTLPNKSYKGVNSIIHFSYMYEWANIHISCWNFEKRVLKIDKSRELPTLVPKLYL